MEIPMYQTEWHGLDLSQFPASADARDKPASPEFYSQFYTALEARGTVNPDFERVRREYGTNLLRLFVEPEKKRLSKMPTILSLGVGKAYIEDPWLAAGFDLTLQECQPYSIAKTLEKYPATKTAIGDVLTIPLDQTYDIVCAFALDCCVSRTDFLKLLKRVKSWLRPGGLFMLYSPTTLSLRRLAVEVTKTLLGRRKIKSYVFWGWWRSLGEYRKLGGMAGLRFEANWDISGQTAKRRKTLINLHSCVSFMTFRNPH
jgi:SAM-dependent methyltransferase